MESEWKEVTLSDISERIGDGLHGTPKYSNDGLYYFINGNNLENGQISFKEATQKVNLEQYELYKKELGLQTILVSINGTIGNVALYNGEKVVLGKSACYINLKSEYSRNFIKFVLSGHLFQEYIQRCSDGSTIKNVSLKLIRDFSFKLPPTKQEQDQCIEILSDLDENIIINREINQILETMAKTLFKSWFVDFDPVIDNALDAGNLIPAALRTKADLRQTMRASADFTPLPDDIRNLFPSEFEESELGWIPKGWEVKGLDEIANYKNGLALQNFRPEGHDFLPVLKIAQLKKGIADSEEKASPDINQEYIVENGDVVFSWSGSLMVDIWCGGQVALNQHLFKVTSEKYQKWFYYYHTKKHLAEFQRIAAAKAVTMGHIKREHLAKAMCVIPPIPLLRKVNTLIGSLLSNQITQRLENNTLANLRDTLLPKLISGEIQISSEV